MVLITLLNLRVTHMVWALFAKCNKYPLFEWNSSVDVSQLTKTVFKCLPYKLLCAQSTVGTPGVDN